jgi:hypothetical protein
MCHQGACPGVLYSFHRISSRSFTLCSAEAPRLSRKCCRSCGYEVSGISQCRTNILCSYHHKCRQQVPMAKCAAWHMYMLLTEVSHRG